MTEVSLKVSGSNFVDTVKIAEIVAKVKSDVSETNAIVISKIEKEGQITDNEE